MMKTPLALLLALLISVCGISGCNPSSNEAPDVVMISVGVDDTGPAGLAHTLQIYELLRRGYRVECTLPEPRSTKVIMTGRNTTRRHPEAGATARRLAEEMALVIAKGKKPQFAATKWPVCQFCAAMVGDRIYGSAHSWPDAHCECAGTDLHIVESE